MVTTAKRFDVYLVNLDPTQGSEIQKTKTSLFVEFRERLGIEQLNAINEKIIELSKSRENKEDSPPADPC
jgi:hypothetical protein